MPSLPRKSSATIITALLAALLSPGCSSYQDPERVEGLHMNDPAHAAIVRESDNTYVFSVDGRRPGKRLIFQGAVNTYRQYLLAPGIHTLKLEVAAGGAVSTPTVLTVDLQSKKLYTLKSNAAISFAGMIASTTNCSPTILDDATKLPLKRLPTTNPAIH